MDAPPRAGEYRVIYADPPWRFATYSDKGKGRSAEAHYDCLSLDDIKRFPVASWAAPHAVLLLWATDPLLPRALEVIEAWGFAYKTVGFYWVKLNASVGGAAVARVAAARRARLLHRPRLLDPGQSRAVPAGDTRRAQALGRRRAQAADRTAAPAFAQARRGLWAHRTSPARPLSRTVRPTEPPRLGWLRRPAESCSIAVLSSRGGGLRREP